MQLVIDTNSISSDMTEMYLRENSQNIVVLPREVQLETYKSGTTDQIISQYNLLHRYCDQVVLCKPIGEILALSSNTPDVRERIIDIQQTVAFRINARQLLSEGIFCKEITDYMKKSQEFASSVFDNMYKKKNTMAEFLGATREKFSQSELRLIGTGRPVKGSTSVKMYELAADFGADIYQGLIKKPLNPDSEVALLDSPLYRAGLVIVNYAVHLIGDGAKQRATKKAHNDVIDNMVSMIGTYFDGILTSDQLPLRIHYIVRTALKGSGGTVSDFPFEEAFKDRSRS